MKRRKTDLQDFYFYIVLLLSLYAWIALSSKQQFHKQRLPLPDAKEENLR